MQVKSVLAGMLALGMAAGISAEEARTVFQEEFDRYGFDLPRFSDACSITEAPASLKSLEVLIAAYLSARDGRQVSLPLEY